MTKRSSICLYVLALMGMVVVAAGAHTSAESNEVVRIMLDASQNFPLKNGSDDTLSMLRTSFCQ